MQTRDRDIWFWVGGLVVLVAGLLLLRDILLPFVAGMVIAYFLNPLAARLEARGLSRAQAAALAVGLVALAGTVTAVLLVPLIADQLRQFAATLPGDVERLRSGVEQVMRERLGAGYPALKGMIDKSVADLAQSWSGSAGAVLAAILSRGLALINVVSLILITPVVVFYLLVDWDPMLRRIDDWLPLEHAGTIRRLASEINEALSAFIRGQGAISLVLGLFYAIGLTLAGVPYGLLIGLLTGLFSFVPIVGWVLGVVAASAIAVIHGWPSFTPLAMALGVMGAGMALDTVLLSPRFVGQKIGLHPVWMIFALYAFSYLFGFAGTLVAVPVAAAIAVLVRYALATYLGSHFYRGATDGAEPNAAREEARR